MIYTDDGVLVSLAEHGLCVLASSLPKFETAKVCDVAVSCSLGSGGCMPCRGAMQHGGSMS